MRLRLLATLLAIAAPASAGPAERLEASGFFGALDFSEDNGLGNALAREQRPQTSPTFGARVTYLLLRSSGTTHLDLGVEAELSFTPAWTGYGFEDDRPSYFAPVLGYRGNLMLRLGGWWIEPHVLGGAGAATVISDSPFMAKETDAVYQWGVGATIPVSRQGWHLRLDGRQLFGESMTGELTASYEVLLAVGVRFGAKPAPTPLETPPEPTPIVSAPEPEPDRDSDGDGLLDHVDRCPLEPETVNGFEDDDGCPEPDPDGDKIVTGLDKCPDRPEDFDDFEDDDGCPDEDNDKDGIADAADKCPNAPETVNTFEDDDGCPDQIPAEVLEALAAASKVTFEANRPRLTPRAKATLDRARLVLLQYPTLKLVIVVRPEGEDERHAALAKKRADNVKWYLLEQGVAENRMTTMLGPIADKSGAVLELAIPVQR